MARNAARGTILLAVASFINRVLGFAYRMLVVRLVGAEGIGLYEMVFPVYTLALVITTAGIPVALSKLTAEQTAHGRQRDARQTFRLARNWLALSGALCTGLLFLFAPRLAGLLFADPRAYSVLLAVAPAVLIVSLSSAYRGYFQGQLWLGASAAGQMLEQFTRIAAGLSLTLLLLPQGLEQAATGLALGMVAGELAGLVFLVLWASRAERGSAPAGQPLPLLPLWREMQRLSLPVTLTRVSSALLLSLEALLVPRRLQVAGYTLQQSTELYGQFSGLAFSLVYLPSIVTVSLATGLVPAIAEAMALRQHRLVRYRTREALRLTILTGLPCAVAFLLFPSDLTALLFANPQAGVPLRVLSLGALFFYLQQTTTGILQGLGRMGTILLNSLLGTAANVFLLYALTADPAYGIRGAALAADLGAALTALLNLLSVVRLTRLDVDPRLLLGRPVLAAVLMALVTGSSGLYLRGLAWPAYFWLPAALLVGCGAYAAALTGGGVVTRADLGRFPLLRRWAG